MRIRLFYHLPSLLIGLLYLFFLYLLFPCGSRYSPPPPAGQDEDDDESDEEDASPAAPTPTIVVPPTPVPLTPSGKPKRQVRTEFERKAILEADPLIGDVKPHEVYCKQCSKWIRLNPTQKYTIGNWTNHTKRCSLKKRYASIILFFHYSFLGY